MSANRLQPVTMHSSDDCVTVSSVTTAVGQRERTSRGSISEQYNTSASMSIKSSSICDRAAHKHSSLPPAPSIHGGMRFILLIRKTHRAEPARDQLIRYPVSREFR